MFKRILLATDGSPHSDKALRYARDLALQSSGHVFVVHVVDATPYYLGEPWREQFAGSVHAAGRDMADRAADVLREAGVEAVVEVLEGSPADAILRVADVRECDLIVMGSRGRGDLTSLLLGSVSHRVIAHAHVPVLVAKSEAKKAG